MSAIRDLIKRMDAVGDRHDRIMAELAVEEFAALTAAVEAEEARGDLHANLNQKTAEALGKPLSGDGSSWHDIPEKVAELVCNTDAVRTELRKAKSVFDAAYVDEDLRMAEKYIDAALAALEAK